MCHVLVVAAAGTWRGAGASGSSTNSKNKTPVVSFGGRTHFPSLHCTECGGCIGRGLSRRLCYGVEADRLLTWVLCPLESLADWGSDTGHACWVQMEGEANRLLDENEALAARCGAMLACLLGPGWLPGMSACPPVPRCCLRPPAHCLVPGCSVRVWLNTDRPVAAAAVSCRVLLLERVLAVRGAILNTFFDQQPDGTPAGMPTQASHAQPPAAPAAAAAARSPTPQAAGKSGPAHATAAAAAPKTGASAREAAAPTHAGGGGGGGGGGGSAAAAGAAQSAPSGPRLLGPTSIEGAAAAAAAEQGLGEEEEESDLEEVQAALPEPFDPGGWLPA